MTARMDRLPALPLIVNDPYFSIWCAADHLTDAVPTHWAGEEKPLLGLAVIDGRAYRFLGVNADEAMQTESLEVTPTSTRSSLIAGGVRVSIAFTTPLLLDRPDVLSMPVTYVDMTAESADGRAHAVSLSFFMDDRLCYTQRDIPTDPEKKEKFDKSLDPSYACTEKPAMMRDSYRMAALNIAYMGRLHQGFAGHSGDHIAIDWGYAYLAGEDDVHTCETGLTAEKSGAVDEKAALEMHVYAAYDDVASINYFGRLTPAYYARGGKTILDAISTFRSQRGELLAECHALDESLQKAAFELGGEDYRLIASAAYRHTIGAHKLIADEHGDMVFLSKENDSNGCIGTVDVSYPSIPLFLLYNPEFVRGMCRPILKFASLPVWPFDFAPHDVGRYPHATGQVYGYKNRPGCFVHGLVYPPLYLYPATADAYALRSQMPVEECGNMLIMLCAASRVDGDYSLERAYMPVLEKWVRYLIEFGEDPGEQLCTDDFAGHLAHNINLSAKAVCGVAAYALIRRGLGDEADYTRYMDKAREMAKSWLERASAGDGSTYLTFDRQGWSMKYNLVWDKLLGLELLPDAFYERETKSYLPRMNKYGLPLDSRSDYTKSDWILWAASMADNETFRALIHPVAEYLRDSDTRVAFSDWYYTSTGRYVHFIGRSVQGGLYMPLLMDKWTNK